MENSNRESERLSTSQRQHRTGVLFQPLRPGAEITKSRRNLPHWTQPGVTHYITFRLADSLPFAKVRQWVVERDVWLKHHPEPWAPEEWIEYTRIFHRRVDKWLDAGSGECILARSAVATLVDGALKHFDGMRYCLDDYVIMPNHVHVLVAVGAPDSPSTVLHSWKSFTAHEINKALRRKGVVWQDESFDHIVRSEEQLAYFRSYVRENPAKAKLRAGFLLGRGIGVGMVDEESA